MDFEFDESQLGLQTAVADVLAKECPATYLRSVIDEGHDPIDLWKRLGSLEWPGLAISADEGGSGASALELTIVLEQLGYVGDPTPFLATTSQFAPVVAAAGSAEQRQRFLGPIAAGAAAGTLALSGTDGRWDVTRPPVVARAHDGGWQLSGTAGYVLDADRVDEIVVLASTEAGSQAFVVPAEVLTISRRPALDGSLHLTNVSFDGAVVDDDRRLTGDGVVAFATGLELATTGLAAVMVGACQRALDLVVEYVRSREQFGVQIGSFPAVKHKAVDMYVALERARALAYFAALTIAEDDSRRTIAASMAKAAAGDAQRLVFQDAVQLFGGLGFTWENDLQLYLRRAKAGELLLGSAAQHRLLVGHALLDGPNRPTEVLSGATGL
ncbi:MAG: acyl-CoA dehydrogenase family protein [Mycobacteriales bacterium]